VLLPAAEGISFLGVYGVVAWSLYTKVSTGSGLPAGPSGLLGAVEGFSYLTVLACKYPFVKADYASFDMQQAACCNLPHPPDHKGATRQGLVNHSTRPLVCWISSELPAHNSN
jgi:hypothetical protein